MSMVEEKEPTKVEELIYEMKVGQVMVADVITVTPNSRMSDLQLLLRENRISGLPVVERGKLVGLVSIKDFVKCLMEGRIDDRVEEWMSCDVKTLRNVDPLVQAVKKFDQWGFGRFPVVAHDSGILVGIITKGDIVKGLLNRMESAYQRKERLRLSTNHFFKEIVSADTTVTFHNTVTGKDFAQAGETSSMLKKKLRRLGVAPQIVRRVAIASYEAEMNIVIFTKGGELTARVTPEEITVEVVDSGPGIPDIEKALEPGYSTAPEWVRELGFGAGMGLSNIQKCADDMQLESEVGEGTRLNFKVYLKGNGKES